MGEISTAVFIVPDVKTEVEHQIDSSLHKKNDAESEEIDLQEGIKVEIVEKVEVEDQTDSSSPKKDDGITVIHFSDTITKRNFHRT